MRRSPRRLALSVIALVCAAFLAACSDNSKPKVTSVTVAPVSGEIYVSAAPAGGVRGAAVQYMLRRPETSLPAVTASCHPLQYTATAVLSNRTTKDVSNSPDTRWTSSSTSVASISATGLATGVGLGTTNISAAYKGVSSTGEPLAVDQLNSISVSPSLVTLTQGGTQSYVAAGHFTLASGSSSDFDVSSQVTWDSTDKTVATIDNSGHATSVGPGSTTITATSCDGITVGHATLIVASPSADSLLVAPATITISAGTTTLFTVMEKLANGTIQALPPGTVVTWSSDTTTAATVDPNSGVALGVAAGTADIIATASGLNPGSAVLTVQAATARFAYVADAQGGAIFGGAISGYSVDVTSATPLKTLGPPVPATFPQQVLLHPSGDFMYYIDEHGFLHIDDIHSADGSFAESQQTPVQASTSGTSTNVGVIDPTGRFIYVVSNGDSSALPPIPPSIYGFKIAQTADKTDPMNGALSTLSPTFNPYTDATLNNPSWIMTDRAGKYVYVVNSGNDTISEYSIGADGTLSPLSTPTITTGSFPEFGTTDVNGHLYVANEGPPQSVSGYSINSGTGQLISLGADTPVTGATFTINVITDPTGKYLYVLDSTTSAAPATPPSQVFAFNLDPTTGVIKSQIGNPQPTGASPTGMAIDPTGVLLAIDNNFDNTLSLFKIAGTGSTTPPPGGLTATTPPTVATDSQPLFVVFYTAASGQ